MSEYEQRRWAEAAELAAAMAAQRDALRAELALASEKIRSQRAELDAANEVINSAMCLVADIRHALGDDGKRMQPELLEYARQLVKDAARWQPIEAIPKDGSYFLAANAHGVWVAHWEEFAVSGYKFDKPIRSVMLNHWHITPKSAQYAPPTHWMPLPKPPGAPA